jgi:hypothetical protein
LLTLFAFDTKVIDSPTLTVVLVLVNDNDVKPSLVLPVPSSVFVEQEKNEIVAIKNINMRKCFIIIEILKFE